MTTSLVISGLYALSLLPAAAEPWNCTFTAQCTAGQACDAAEYSVQIIAADHEGQLFLLSDTESQPVTRLAPGAYGAPNHLVTIREDETAILTQHTPQVRSLFGQCEVLE